MATAFSNMKLHMILEYSNFFVGEEPIDVDNVLRKFDRHMLIKIACIQSCHYGNFSLSDEKRRYFSKLSAKYINKLNELYSSFRKRNSLIEKDNVIFLTYRTSLELWRRIFAIKPEDFQGVISEEKAEFELFKVILTLNEKLTCFKHSNNIKSDELVYLNLYLLNDTNNYDFKAIAYSQIHYTYSLSKACNKIDVLKNAQDELFQKWRITSWQQYINTLYYVAHSTENYKKNLTGGVPILDPSKIQDETGIFSATLIDALSIDEDEYIPFNEDDAENREQNVDYRVFRARPFIKLKNDKGYLVTNIELLCERIYNSLFFDFKPLIDGSKNSIGKLDYNTWFVERKLFRDVVRKCIPSYCFVFPKDATQEEIVNEPDFYYRQKNNLVIFECKAIKINGDIRDKADCVRLFDELHEKLVLKTKELRVNKKEKKTKLKGIGQLINHIVAIDKDEFAFDDGIPDEVTYYPILILEDVRLLQPGLLSILNRWFIEMIKTEDNAQQILQGCMPVMVLSIHTLYLYDSLIRRVGLPRIINDFVYEYSIRDNDGNYILNQDADFDAYLRRNKFNKGSELAKWLTS